MGAMMTAWMLLFISSGERRNDQGAVMDRRYCS
jgi:hypothetical protein